MDSIRDALREAGLAGLLYSGRDINIDSDEYEVQPAILIPAVIEATRSDLEERLARSRSETASPATLWGECCRRLVAARVRSGFHATDAMAILDSLRLTIGQLLGEDALASWPTRWDQVVKRYQISNLSY
jgi:hypothetical protein